MEKAYFAALALVASLALPPVMATAQTDTASQTTITQEQKNAAKKALNAARAALRAAKTEDAPAADVDIIRAAASAGDTNATLSLASYLLPRDADAAIKLYDDLIAQDNPKGMMGLATAYWSGEFIEQDRTKADALMQQAVNAGDPAAILIYARWLPILDREKGTDQALALVADNADIVNAEKAADIKASLELRKASTALREAKTEDASPADVDMIRAAASAGDTNATLSLASYLLPRDTDAAVKLYEDLIAQDNPKGMTTLASAYWSGTSVEQDRPKAGALMQQAIAAGDTNAILTYARWLPTLDKETGVAQALVLLESNADFLDADKTGPMIADLKLKGNLSFRMREDVANWIADVPATNRDAIIRSTLDKDQNLYVWLMQGVMSERGLYTGARNGLLTSSTARGFNALCAELGVTAGCVRGPLNSNSAKAVANALKAEMG